MKLTPAQKIMLERAIKNGGGVRNHGGYEDRTAQSLINRDLLRNAIPGYGPDYYITEAGRRALEEQRRGS